MSDYSPLVFFSIYTVVSSVILLNVVVAVPACPTALPPPTRSRARCGPGG